MNKWKISFFTSITILLMVSAWYVYKTIDMGVSYTYLEQSYDDQKKANEVLGNLIVKGGQSYTQKDLLYLLRQEYPHAFIVEDGNKISMGSNLFIFKNNKLAAAQ